MNLKEILEYLYGEEQNCRVSSFWDAGWLFELGDKTNGFKWSDGPYYDLNEGAQAMLKAYEEMKAGK